MQPVQTAATSAKLDAETQVPLEVLMGRAGLAVALAAVEMGVSYGSRVVVLAGSGNNGGDGYIAAHHLARRGIAVTVFAFAPPAGDVSRRAADRAIRSGVRVRDWPDQPVPCDLVIDALFGCGFHGRLHDRIVPWTNTNAPVLSIDVPSGADASTGAVNGPVFAADRTVTFHAYKVGHFVGAAAEAAGKVTVVDIGLSGGEAEFWLAEESEATLPRRHHSSHKWSVGSVLVIGGSKGMTGAALLAARSALRFGAGSVAIAVNQANASAYLQAPELLTPILGEGSGWSVEDVSAVLATASRFDVVILGPGLDGNDEFMRQILERRAGRIVVDAGALHIRNVIDVLSQREGESILTPHHGEFRAMTGRDGSYRSANQLAKETGATVVLKGHPTFVASDRLVAVTTGGSELSTIGTGDVLAGMIGAAWARGLDAPAAAVAGAYWHGRAGAEIAKTSSVTADGLLSEIGRWAS